MYASLVAVVLVGQVYTVPDGKGGFVTGSSEAIRRYQEERALRPGAPVPDGAQPNPWYAQRDAWVKDRVAERIAAQPDLDQAVAKMQATDELRPLAAEARKEKARVAAKKVPDVVKRTDWKVALERLAKAKGTSPTMIERAMVLDEDDPSRGARIIGKDGKSRPIAPLDPPKKASTRKR